MGCAPSKQQQQQTTTEPQQKSQQRNAAPNQVQEQRSTSPPPAQQPPQPPQQQQAMSNKEAAQPRTAPPPEAKEAREAATPPPPPPDASAAAAANAEEESSESSVRKSPLSSPNHTQRKDRNSQGAEVPPPQTPDEDDPYAAQMREANDTIKKSTEEQKQQQANAERSKNVPSPRKESHDGPAEPPTPKSPVVSSTERIKDWLASSILPTDPKDEDYDACSTEVKRRAPAPKTVAAPLDGATSPTPSNKPQLTGNMECLDAFGVTDEVLVKADKVAQGVDTDEDSESVNDSEWLYCLDELQKEYEDREQQIGGMVGATSPE